MKRISILGSTGSIGVNTLKIVKMFPGFFTVKAVSAKTNIHLLADQVEQFKPDVAVVIDQDHAHRLEKILPPGSGTEILFGEDGYQAAATLDSVDMVVSAMVGSAGLLPTLAAIEKKKEIALANKETLVMAGEIVMDRASACGVKILPIDSEHSAIFQSLAGNRHEDIRKILITASGGPFRHFSIKEFEGIRVEDALNHPNWEMGRKITIDSATLMNKGLEVIEAKHLFNIKLDMIEVVIHPESIVHSMVAFHDGSIIAQLGVPDMKGAIAYALSFPQRLPLSQPIPDFCELGELTFQAPDIEKFPCLHLAFNACRTGGTVPAILNSANEMAVQAFLEKKISYTDIYKVVHQTIEDHEVISGPTLSDILEADNWGRIRSKMMIREIENEKRKA